MHSVPGCSAASFCCKPWLPTFQTTQKPSDNTVLSIIIDFYQNLFLSISTTYDVFSIVLLSHSIADVQSKYQHVVLHLECP